MALGTRWIRSKLQKLENSLSDYVLKSGDTMTGPLTMDFAEESRVFILFKGNAAYGYEIGTDTGDLYFNPEGNIFFGTTFSAMVDNNTDFGTSAIRWKDGYFGGSLSNGTTSTTVANILQKSGGTMAGTLSVQHIVPVDDNTWWLGNPTHYFSTLFVGEILFSSAVRVYLQDANTVSFGDTNLAPDSDGARTLGTAAMRWNNIYLAGYLQEDGNVASVAQIRTGLDYLNQAVLTTSSPTFAGITVTGTANIKRIILLKVIADDTALTTGDGKMYFFIPSDLNGYNLVDADAGVHTVSTAGLPTIQINNVTQTADMLSTRITIDINEKTSYTAATAPVIDAANDDVATGDELRIDVDVAGTGTKGLDVILVFQLP